MNENLRPASDEAATHMRWLVDNAPLIGPDFLNDWEKRFMGTMLRLFSRKPRPCISEAQEKSIGYVYENCRMKVAGKSLGIESTQFEEAMEELHLWEGD